MCECGLCQYYQYITILYEALITYFMDLGFIYTIWLTDNHNVMWYNHNVGLWNEQKILAFIVHDHSANCFMLGCLKRWFWIGTVSIKVCLCFYGLEHCWFLDLCVMSSEWPFGLVSWLSKQHMSSYWVINSCYVLPWSNLRSWPGSVKIYIKLD